MTCLECDQPARSKGLCQPHYHRARRARLAEQRAQETRDRLSDLEWLLDMGECPPRAAARCGWTVTGAEKAARVHGYTGLSRTLQGCKEAA